MAYDVNKLVNLGGLQELSERVANRLGVAKAEAAKGFKSGKVDGNKVYLYTSADKSGTAAFSFDFPKELFLDQAKTVFVPSFTWSNTTYPGSTDPSLNGKPVMVLAVKGTNPDSCTYSFLNMEALVDTYGKATTSADGLMSKEDKSKLDGIAVGANKTVVDASLSATSTNPVQNKAVKAALDGKAASSHTHSDYVNQNAFSNVKVGDVTVAADTATDTLTLVAGSNVTITPDATNDTVTIAAKDTTYSAATTSAPGLMSAADKTKLDGISAGANAYTHPTTSGNKHIPAGGSSGQILRWSADGTAVWGADNNTTYTAATTTKDGLMSKTDKTNLDNMKTKLDGMVVADESEVAEMLTVVFGS